MTAVREGIVGLWLDREDGDLLLVLSESSFLALTRPDVYGRKTSSDLCWL